MGKSTAIEWCDSTCNLQMGCDGCELWTHMTKKCYAGVMTNIYGGGTGWPESFDKPRLFLERLDAALKWSDLTGQPREGKGWLHGLPRLIFLNDMGDTFTESLDLDWLSPFVPRMADSPHIWQILTKRPGRMLQFFRSLGYVPNNFWLGTSITRQANLHVRLSYLTRLSRIDGGFGRRFFLSCEPLLEQIDLRNYLFPDESHPSHGLLANEPLIDWVIVGGESGPGARPCHMEWVYDIVDQCREANVPVFVKQMGDNSYYAGDRMRYLGSKGKDMSKWPYMLQVRQMPYDLG